MKPHSRRHALCYIKYICVRACFVLEFSCCVSRSRPLARNDILCVLRDTLQLRCWNQNTDAIRDYRSQDTLLLKRARINCPYMLMPKVYGFLWCLCYILVQFPPYSRGQDWNVSQMHSYVARINIRVSWLHSRITTCHLLGVSSHECF